VSLVSTCVNISSSFPILSMNRSAPRRTLVWGLRVSRPRPCRRRAPGRCRSPRP
jgi:hypothetical protein